MNNQRESRKGWGNENQSRSFGRLELRRRIANLFICLTFLLPGCATSPPFEYETPFATIEVPLTGSEMEFFGTEAVVTKDAVWVVVPEKPHIYKIDPWEKRFLAAISVGAKTNTYFLLFHSSLAESGNTVWVSAENTLIRIDSDRGNVVTRIPVGRTPFILSGSDSAIWIGISSFWSGDYKVSKMDPQTNRVIVTLPQELSMRSARVTPGDDAVWLLDGWEETLSRIDPKSGHEIASLPLGSSSIAQWPAAIGGGSIWVANADEGTVVRVDPETSQVSATIPISNQVSGRPDTFFGPPIFAEGAVWVAGGYDGGEYVTVHAIDPCTNQVVSALHAPIKMGFGFAIGHGAIWIPTSKSDQLVLEVYRLPKWKMSRGHC